MTPQEWQIWAKNFPMRASADAKYVSPFKVLAAVDNRVDVLLYGPIGKDYSGDDGNSAAEFAEILAAIPKSQKVRLRIDSPGGNLWDGNTIYNLAQERGVEIRVDGMAASAAAVILCAGPSEAPENSSVMIHKCSGIFFGNADQVDEFKALLNKHDDMQSAVFAAKTGKTAASIKAEMSRDKWFTAKEAKEFGLIDSISKPATNSKAAQSSAPSKPQANASADDSAALLSAAAKDGGQQETNENNTMNKKLIVALLAKHGITASETETEEQLQAKLDQIAVQKPAPTATATATPPAPAATQTGTLNAELEAKLNRIQAQLDKERKDNVERQLDQLVIDNKITAEEAKEFAPVCVADTTEKILATLKKREPVLPGTAPLGNVSIQGSSAREAIKATKQGKERMNFLRAEWQNLIRAGVPVVAPRRADGTRIQAANTTDSTALTTDMLSSAFLTVLQNRCPNLTAFTRDFGTDPLKPNAKVQVGITTAGGTAQENATNFEDGTNFVGTIDNIEVTVARITSGAHITPAELNNGFRMAQFAEIKAHELADKIQSKINAIILSTNFDRTTELGVPALVSAEAAFGHTELADIWAAIAKSGVKGIMLNAKAFSRFIAKNLEEFNVLSGGLPGWDTFALNTYWTGAEANTYGFACNPQAIAVASGLPLASPNRGMTTLVTNLSLPGIGLTVEQQEWYNTADKFDWMNWEVMFGAAKGDGSAGALIKSA